MTRVLVKGRGTYTEVDMDTIRTDAIRAKRHLANIAFECPRVPAWEDRYLRAYNAERAARDLYRAVRGW